MTPRKIESGVIPPEADDEFVAPLEEVLDTSEQPDTLAIPVIGMDEQPEPFWKKTRPPIPATAKPAKCVNYEYE